MRPILARAAPPHRTERTAHRPFGRARHHASEPVGRSIRTYGSSVWVGPLAALVLSASAAETRAGQALQAAVATPAIDRSIYRDGAVTRTDRRFGAWTLTCDEIASLSRKFCSLRGNARSADGTIIAALAVSTDDRGRPAALITLPLGTMLGSGVMVLRPATGKARPTELGLRPALCDGRGCEVIWSLGADDVRTLSAGAPLKMSFAMAKRGGPSLQLATATSATMTVAGALPTVGFADALKASFQ